MEIQTRTLSIINPHRSSSSKLEHFPYGKAWVYKLVFDDFWELMRWKVNVHFFLSFYVFGININLKNDKLRRIFIFINLILSTKIKHRMILDFSSYNLVVYFYIFILKSTRNLLRSKKIPFQEDQTNPSRIINPNNRTPPFRNRSRACSNGPRKRFRGRKKKKMCHEVQKDYQDPFRGRWIRLRCAEVCRGALWKPLTRRYTNVAVSRRVVDNAEFALTESHIV